MAEEESLADRLTEEITSLSTKLVTAVSKQSELEEKLYQFHKENHQLKTQVARLTDIEQKYNDISQKHTTLDTDFKKVKQERDHLDAENKKLEGEVEDLTASLFDEANKMVSDASRETYNFKVKNRKLYEELDEKNLIIDNLQNELVELKKLFENLEKKNKNKRISTHKDESTGSFSLGGETDKESAANSPEVARGTPIDSDDIVGAPLLSEPVFAPKVKAIRFDLDNFKEFKEFAFHLIQPNAQFDLNSLRLNKWFKKIWVEEIENCVVVPSTNLFNRWQKGKFFWNAIIEGKIKIEPVKNIQDKFKESPKIGLRNSTHNESGICDFCQESRTEGLEHLRLHTLKLTHTEIDGSIDYPLCNYCLIKIRNVCELFAKLRLLHKNFYKLDFDSSENEFKLMKIYVTLCVIRSKNFWSKIGYYDNENEVAEVDVDEIELDDFKLLITDDNFSIHSNEAVKSVKSVDVPKQQEETPDSDENSDDFKDPAGEGFEMAGAPVEEAQATEKATEKEALEQATEPVKEQATEPTEEPKAPAIEVPTETPEPPKEPVKETTHEVAQPTEEPATQQVAEPSTKSKKKKKNKKNKVSGLVNAFEEPKAEPETVSKPKPEAEQPEPQPEPEKEAPETIDLTLDEEEFADSVDLEQAEPQLTRKNSKSKQFSKRVSSGLDDTLKMLEESINEAE